MEEIVPFRVPLALEHVYLTESWLCRFPDSGIHQKWLVYAASQCFGKHGVEVHLRREA